ncbi:hypothetical protein DFH06DRAFT_1320447 [Mycena polygramma]|nr:hypothetical protein DFH06DRAFT_1320447 [Mycena polygramma]
MRDTRQNTALPNLHFYVQNDATRTCVDSDPQYLAMRTLARQALAHLVTSRRAWHTLLSLLGVIVTKRADAQEALRARLGSDRELETADIIAFFQYNTPSVIFKDLPDENGEVIWGLVLKGDEEGADTNELFISLEMVQALRSLPPSHLTIAEAEQQRLRQEFLFVVTLMHELTHTMTKFFFGHTFITPKLPTFQKDPRGSGMGQAGLTFEKNYIGFVTETVWAKEEAEMADRLWRVQFIVARATSRLRVLSDLDISRVLQSMLKKDLWPVVADDLLPLPDTVTKNTHVRHRGGGVPMLIVEEEDQDDGEHEYDDEGDSDGDGDGPLFEGSGFEEEEEEESEEEQEEDEEEQQEEEEESSEHESEG